MSATITFSPLYFPPLVLCAMFLYFRYTLGTFKTLGIEEEAIRLFIFFPFKELLNRPHLASKFPLRSPPFFRDREVPSGGSIFTVHNLFLPLPKDTRSVVSSLFEIRHPTLATSPPLSFVFLSRMSHSISLGWPQPDRSHLDLPPIHFRGRRRPHGFTMRRYPFVPFPLGSSCFDVEVLFPVSSVHFYCLVTSFHSRCFLAIPRYLLPSSFPLSHLYQRRHLMDRNPECASLFILPSPIWV